MLKRNIAILIAGGLLGAQANLAGAGGSAFQRGAEENSSWTQVLPAQARYLEQRAANLQGVVGGDSFPMSADEQGRGVGSTLPAQANYFDQRAASINLAQEPANQRTVNITASTKYINAEHDGVLVIKNDKGQSFTWRADTLGEAEIPLKAIAPKDFAAGQTRVFVRHPPAHIPG